MNLASSTNNKTNTTQASACTTPRNIRQKIYIIEKCDSDAYCIVFFLLDMARIPVRFQRVAAAFDADVARVGLCESSGSEHSPESLTDLSDLVKSFMEKNEATTGEKEEEEVGDVREGHDEEEFEKTEWSYSEKREMLRSLLYENDDDEDERDDKEKIRREAEVAFGVVVGNYSKRRLMSLLREKGFDAG